MNKTVCVAGASGLVGSSIEKQRFLEATLSMARCEMQPLKTKLINSIN